MSDDQPPRMEVIRTKRADARLIMFYKIVHGLVEIPLPSYIHRQVRMTKTAHPYHFIQIQTTANYYKYSFFPLAIVQWNSCSTRSPEYVRVCHLQPKPHHAINPEYVVVVFSQLLTFYFFFHANIMIILFCLLHLNFLLSTFSLTRAPAHNLRERVMQYI